MKIFFHWIIVLYLRVWARLALWIAHPVEVIGVAGSVGKSTTREMLRAVLKPHMRVKMLWGNSETGIALSILGISAGDYSVVDWGRMVLLAPLGILHLRGFTHVIVEMGTDDLDPPKNMGFLLTIIRPTIAIHLNATATHTMQFGRHLEHADNQYETILGLIAREDGRSITNSHCRVAIYNQSDMHIREYMNTFRKTTQAGIICSFGSETACDMRLKSWSLNARGTTYELFTKGEHITKITIDSYALPRIYWENIASVLLCAQQLDICLRDCVSALERGVDFPKGRCGLFDGVRDTLILDSSYNASKIPMYELLTVAQGLSKKQKIPLTIVFGDMRELGAQAQSEHEQVAQAIIATRPAQVHLVGALTREFMQKILENDTSINVHWWQSSRELGAYLKMHVTPGSIVLFKGSQNTIYLEEAIAQILLHKADVKKLCRMSDGWRAIKQKYYTNV